ncbi:tetratricopeptide repeat protein [Galbitalea sp. SE-J8]|uniref:ATP-binding protein n=1 Tax=Galbitalea sp. SE-J8 TaxID=3054952 RepID=UPI00259CBF20|nr:helix-turn-helix domain-containing protein [Galbitalea sp. SE-J8]MDM4762807.1 tetratricopeptide repeat protein [Galbitalea sp. SE-J8]
MSAFGDRLRTFRRGAGMTMEQLAEASGVSARAISDMERGHSRAPQSRTLAALVEGLRLTGDDRAELVAAATAARSSGAVGRPRLGELPRGVSSFVGRRAELALARATADRISGSADGPPPVLVVHGQAGLGKTTLAVRAAEELRASFPDGRLYVDLRGTDPEPMPPGEALHRLLRALGLSAGSIADTDDERSAQLRAALRELRCLLVLDNAGSEAQVRPLLPAEGASLVVVTSRRVLGGLEGVSRVALAPLTPDESAGLLGSLAAQAADPAAAGQVEMVSRLCGHLPLALRIAGTRLASRPQWTVRTLADQLADADRRLTALTAGDTGVVAAFALSHAQLSDSTALLFRRLALVPSVDFATPVAAVLAGTGLPEAEERLDELVELGLLIPEGVDRYRFHDLIRLYARERLRADEPADARAAAVRRMTDWLLETAIVAGRWYESDYGGLPDGWDGLVPLASLEEAGAWLRAETDGWLAALRMAAAEGRDQLVCDLSAATYFYSDTCLEWQGWYEVRGLSRTAAAALPDRSQQAHHHSLYSLAATYTMRRYEEGAESAMTAHRLADEVGDLREQARALGHAGQAWVNLRRFEDALQAHRTGRELAERAGDHEISVEQLVGSGTALQYLGRHDEAVFDYEQALAELDTRALSPRSELNIRSTALQCLADVHARAGRWEESLHAAELALPLQAEVGDTVATGWTLIALGRARAELGRHDEARADLIRGIELIDAAIPPGAAPDRRAAEARELLADLAT